MASKCFGKLVAEVMREAHFEAVSIVPNTYHHSQGDIDTVVHGDDFLAVAENGQLDHLEQVLEISLAIKRIGRIGPGRSSTGKVLQRVVNWSGDGFGWEADPRLTEKLINMLNLSGSKGALTPGGRDIGKDDRDVDCDLEYTEPSRVSVLCPELEVTQAGGHTPFLWLIMLMFLLLPASAQWLHLGSGCRPTARTSSRRTWLALDQRPPCWSGSRPFRMQGHRTRWTPVKQCKVPCGTTPRTALQPRAVLERGQDMKEESSTCASLNVSTTLCGNHTVDRQTRYQRQHPQLSITAP